VLDIIGVEREMHADELKVRWTEEQARAFELLHILPHEGRDAATSHGSS
jgi:hypothetical protein